MMDIVLPNIEKPSVLVECGVFATTARELSEKASFSSPRGCKKNLDYFTSGRTIQ